MDIQAKMTWIWMGFFSSTASLPYRSYTKNSHTAKSPTKQWSKIPLEQLQNILKTLELLLPFSLVEIKAEMKILAKHLVNRKIKGKDN